MPTTPCTNHWNQSPDPPPHTSHSNTDIDIVLSDDAYILEVGDIDHGLTWRKLNVSNSAGLKRDGHYSLQSPNKEFIIIGGGYRLDLTTF